MADVNNGWYQGGDTIKYDPGTIKPQDKYIPTYHGLLNSNGQLNNKFQLGDQGALKYNQAGINAYQKEALRSPTQQSPWAALQNQQLNQQRTQSLDDAAQRSAGAQAQAVAQMQRIGGVSPGQRMQLAQQQFRNQALAGQKIAGADAANRLNVNIQDEQNRQNMLGKAADMNFQQANIANQDRSYATDVDKYNRGLAAADVQKHADFDQNRYNQSMQNWASANLANFMQNQGTPGNSCCFIFLEARYGNGVMDSVVRRFRDEHMTVKNRRGYYKLSDVLVPLMRKYVIVKLLVRLTMTDPLVAYGKYHYGENKWGKIFTPIKNFWLKTFEYLGGDHKFIRENGEVI